MRRFGARKRERRPGTEFALAGFVMVLNRQHDRPQTRFALDEAMGLGRLFHGLYAIDDRADLALFDQFPQCVQPGPSFGSEGDVDALARKVVGHQCSQHVGKAGIGDQVTPAGS